MGSSSPQDHRPPYQRPDESSPEREKFEKKLRGECHCGQVVYWLSTDNPLDVKYCHCHDCQVLHGAPFQLTAILHKADMAFENGTKGLHFYKTGTKRAEYNLPCKVSCSQCGTFILDEGRNMVLISPSPLNLQTKQQRANFDVRRHIFYERRVKDIYDGKPKWAGLDRQSQRLKDSGEPESE
ncbi:hypothetical protein ACRE_038390 [Hapsidospora chrysogenum ATCC 11550]|uniref:CENP-V/GFA domain-containing protein n=1 Tax=Hapsidospora chrysogenum (strain ATCC 11550 / CBS 779.69 / DSM 880 / IAM 14645 / JCM 23072 / IMI 49137) TaxID=857340 RepID=A0A086T7Q3_HAPC1|nr:hypothetical protein ACRE_038390 [Hapsidospora chrysogenum ATCC 11550]